MKIFAFILSVMVLVMSCMPCADAATLLKEPKQKFETVKSTHQQDKDKTDTCSPFCQCACCAGFSMNHSPAVIPAVTSFSESPTSSFLSSEVSAIAFPIWQPPQLL